MKRRAASLLAALALIIAGAATASPSPAAADPCPNADTLPVLTLFNLQLFEQATVCLVNEQRIDAGLVPLQPNTDLDETAQAHSSSMRWQGYFGHSSPDGTTFEDRITATGYLRGATSWVVGENIAWGSFLLGTPRAIVNAWMNSPEHRANILEPRYREIGVGADFGSPLDPNAAGSVIVTHDFGVLSYSYSHDLRSTKARAKQKKKARRRRRRLGT